MKIAFCCYPNTMTSGCGDTIDIVSVAEHALLSATVLEQATSADVSNRIQPFIKQITPVIDEIKAIRKTQQNCEKRTLLQKYARYNEQRRLNRLLDHLQSLTLSLALMLQAVQLGQPVENSKG